jgi:hypothetical protein
LTEYSDKFYSRVKELIGEKPPMDWDDKVNWWLVVARLAVKHFPDKAAFMVWVNLIYTVEENRFTACMAWDIVGLEHSSGEA